MELIIVDPTQVLKDILALKERLLTQPLNRRERDAVGRELATMLYNLEHWCRAGGFQPTWPQRRLTDDECRQLVLAGHRPGV